MTSEGKEACIKSGAPTVLTALLREDSLMENDNAVSNVAGALWYIAKSSNGKVACVNAGAPSALMAIARNKKNWKSVKNIANAFKAITGQALERS